LVSKIDFIIIIIMTFLVDIMFLLSLQEYWTSFESHYISALLYTWTSVIGFHLIKNTNVWCTWV